MAVTCAFTILLWDCLCILAHIFGIGLLLIDQDHEGGRQGSDGADDTGHRPHVGPGGQSHH